MTIDDEATAHEWLSVVSYYRLSGYWLYFEQYGAQRFRVGTRFEDIVALYNFDRILRRLVFRATEHVEIALRGSWAYAMGQQGGSHGYLNASLYSDRARLHENLAKLTRTIGMSKETFVRHYRDQYDAPLMPPVWVAAEVMTFGEVARWYGLLNNTGPRNQIAGRFGLNDAVIAPLMQHLSVVRNVCAHHNRLWNRRFTQPPALPRKGPPGLVATLEPATGPAMLYNTLVLLIHLIGEIAPDSTWRGDIRAHLLTHPTNDLTTMGFPKSWEARSLWS